MSEGQEEKLDRLLEGLRQRDGSAMVEIMALPDDQLQAFIDKLGAFIDSYPMPEQ